MHSTAVNVAGIPLYRQWSEESFQGILKDMMFILHPEIDSSKSCLETSRKTIEFYEYEYPQRRFGGLTEAEVRVEALQSGKPIQYPVKPNRRILQFWEKLYKKGLTDNSVNPQ